MAKSIELPVLPLGSKRKWAAWLAKQHKTSTDVWLKLANKDSGVPSVTYDEAVEVALCYGWALAPAPVRCRWTEEGFRRQILASEVYTAWSKEQLVEDQHRKGAEVDRQR